MTINRRRAPSSEISREKKISGHKNEDIFASLIDGETISGTQKADVKDKFGNKFSVKSGKKWQIFLYGYDRIANSKKLSILKPCLDSFPQNANDYFKDRIKCIEFKENYLSSHGKEKTKLLSNLEIALQLGTNSYIKSKQELSNSTLDVCDSLKDKDFLKSFLEEAIFNNLDVDLISIKDDTFLQDQVFKVFEKVEVLNILTRELTPSVSRAGFVPQDYNVAAQKTLLSYSRDGKVLKNLIEIEIRNDSPAHYRQVRFNMYSKDTLSILTNAFREKNPTKINKNVWLYGDSKEKMKF